ncbi:hypothetical protein EDB81DRAFT_916262 [Dactylonectria macrodidyma]|uniref:TRI14-like protein n=1 Tax=Dactylonectria macrodidyma TaxID=307937 RepID=A0A9P9DDL4_9HYPO|nr:hypothetical protein EDB81DRAFT_916262 [Dactylonectria macrodidyma]
MIRFPFWTLTVAFFPALASCVPHRCPSPAGDLSISAFQLYPENADFDPKRCVAYFSVLYNSSVAVYNPSQNAVVDVLKFPGLSGNPLLHASGVQLDPLDRLSVVVDAGSSFDTGGQDISGDNWLVKYSLHEDRVLWKYNLTALTAGAYSGFQDIEHDRHGNTFVLGTFPTSLIRVSADGKKATPWYLGPRSNPPVAAGFTGLVNIGDALVVSNIADGQLYRFDITSAKGHPVRIPLTTAQGRIGGALDGVYLPPRYAGKVILVSDNVNGTIILRSSDAKWKTAERLGVIPNDFLAQGGSTVASVQIGDRIYAVTEFFGDSVVPGTLAGNRSTFPLIDISTQIERLLC